MKILHLIATTDPADGGPIEYARVMAAAHQADGHKVAFASVELPDAPHLRDFPFEVHATSAGRGLLAPRAYGRAVAKLLPGYDVAIVHGLWNPATFGADRALRRAGVPWVVFPHGMLDPYFKHTARVKHLAKQLVWALWQGHVLTGASQVLFTCEEERRLAEGVFAGHAHRRERVIAFCAQDQRRDQDALARGRAALAQAIPNLGDRRFLLFLSRIDRKKGCDILIDAFASIASAEPDLDLVLAGPDATGWMPALQQTAIALGVEDRLHWPGMIRNDTKTAAFSEAAAFVLSSHQENFGLVVAEALSVGTPVLISDKVNIWREIVDDGAGMVEPDTAEGTRRLLRRWLALSPAEQAQMRERARPCYAKRFSVDSAARDLMAALEDAVAGKHT